MERRVIIRKGKYWNVREKHEIHRSKLSEKRNKERKGRAKLKTSNKRRAKQKRYDSQRHVKQRKETGNEKKSAGF